PPGTAANLGPARCGAASSGRSIRTAKINLLLANLRSVTNVPPPRSLQFFAVAGSNRFGKIGTRRFAVHDNLICNGGLRAPDSPAIKSSLNGETAAARAAKTIAELIESYELLPQSILVEHNGLAVHRYEWPERRLAEGDHIEFVRVVAGG